MNNEHDNLASLADLRLSPEEKAHMKAMLQLHIASYAPRPAWAAFILRHGIASALVAVLLLAGTSTVLAHRSLPGDLFYPMKLSVNDRVALVVAGDDDAKLDAELSQIERMLRDEERVAFAVFDGEFFDNDYADDLTDEQDDRDDGGRDGQRPGPPNDDEQWLDEVSSELHALKRENETTAEDVASAEHEPRPID